MSQLRRSKTMNAPIPQDTFTRHIIPSVPVPEKGLVVGTALRLAALTLHRSSTTPSRREASGPSIAIVHEAESLATTILDYPLPTSEEGHGSQGCRIWPVVVTPLRSGFVRRL